MNEFEDYDDETGELRPARVTTPLITKGDARPHCARCGNPQGRHLSARGGVMYAKQEWVDGKLEVADLICEGFLYPEPPPVDAHAGHNGRTVRELYATCEVCFRRKWEWMRDSPTMARYTYELLAPKLGLPIEPAQPRRGKRPSTRVDNVVHDAMHESKGKPLYG